VNSDNPGTKVQISATEILDIIPTKTIRIPVDAQKVIASGTVSREDSAKIVPYIDIKLKGSSILKSQLIVLDILAHNDWNRPIYFVTGYHNDALGLEEYFQLEGLAYRLVPIKSENRSWLDYGRIETDILYNNIMNKFVWGGANDEKVNIDYNHRRTITVVRARLNYSRLARELVSEGRTEKAVEVLDRCLEVLPLNNVPYDPYFPDIIESYFKAGNIDKAVTLTDDFCNHYYEQLDYYLKQSPYILSSAMYEIQMAIQFTSRIADACDNAGQKELADAINRKVTAYYSTYLELQNPVPEQ
jgi:tetratricopeptide (TPR) repeat protein